MDNHSLFRKNFGRGRVPGLAAKYAAFISYSYALPPPPPEEAVKVTG